MRLTTAPILIVSEQGQRYTVYCDTSRGRTGMCLDEVLEGRGFWF